MPTKTIPRELPEGYDLRENTLYATTCGKGSSSVQPGENDDKMHELKDGSESEIEVEPKESSSSIEVLKEFGQQIASVQFAALAVWYCLVSLRINSFQSWFNPSLEWMFPGEKHIQSELTNIFGLTYIMSLPISPSAGAIVDYFAKKYREDSNNEFKGRTIGVAFVCGICTIFASILSFLCSFQHNYVIAGKAFDFYFRTVINNTYNYF